MASITTIPIQNKVWSFDKGRISIQSRKDIHNFWPVISLPGIWPEEVILLSEKVLGRKKFIAGRNWHPPDRQTVPQPRYRKWGSGLSHCVFMKKEM